MWIDNIFLLGSLVVQCLEAATDIGSCQAMMEYRGKVILRAQYQKQNPALYTKKLVIRFKFDCKV